MREHGAAFESLQLRQSPGKSTSGRRHPTAAADGQHISGSSRTSIGLRLQARSAESRPEPASPDRRSHRSCAGSRVRPRGRAADEPDSTTFPRAPPRTMPSAGRRAADGMNRCPRPGRHPGAATAITRRNRSPTASDGRRTRRATRYWPRSSRARCPFEPAGRRLARRAGSCQVKNVGSGQKRQRSQDDDEHSEQPRPRTRTRPPYARPRGPE